LALTCGTASAKTDNPNAVGQSQNATATAPASNTDNGNGNSNTTATTASTSVKTTKDLDLKAKDWKTDLQNYKTAAQDKKLAQLKILASTVIDNRISSLTSLKTRLTETARIDEQAKADIIKDIGDAITSLTTLKTQAAAATDLTALKALIKQVYQTNKIYSVVMPREMGLAAVARGMYIMGRLTALETKLNTIIASATAEQKTQITALKTQFEAKLADAKTQLTTAQTQFKNMTPANTEAAKTAREAGKAAFNLAKDDLKAAHDLIKQILAILQGTQTQTQTQTQTETQTTTQTTATPATTTTPTTTTTSQ
jgi:hypothetical protein